MKQLLKHTPNRYQPLNMPTLVIMSDEYSVLTYLYTGCKIDHIRYIHSTLLLHQSRSSI